MRWLAVLLSAVALAVGGWYLTSPSLAMKDIVEAARAGDVAALEEKVDFARLQEKARGQLRREIDRRAGRGDVLDSLGRVVAGELAGAAVGQVVTPQGVANLVTIGGFAMPFVPDRYRGQQLEWDVERNGFDAFAGVSHWEDGTPGPTMQFARDGIGWDLVGVQLAPVE